MYANGNSNEIYRVQYWEGEWFSCTQFLVIAHSLLSLSPLCVEEVSHFISIYSFLTHITILLINAILLSIFFFLLNTCTFFFSCVSLLLFSLPIHSPTSHPPFVLLVLLLRLLTLTTLPHTAHYNVRSDSVTTDLAIINRLSLSTMRRTNFPHCILELMALNLSLCQSWRGRKGEYYDDRCTPPGSCDRTLTVEFTAEELLLKQLCCRFYGFRRSQTFSLRLKSEQCFWEGIWPT